MTVTVWVGIGSFIGGILANKVVVAWINKTKAKVAIQVKEVATEVATKL